MKTTIRRLGALFLLTAAALGGGRAARAELVYVSTLDGFGHPNAFESVDTSTGAVTVISRDTPALTGMAFVNGQLYGVGYSSGELYRIDTATGAATDLGTIAQNGAGSGGSDLVAGPGGSVYLFDSSQGNVFSLTPPSTSVTLTSLPYFGGELKYAAGSDGRIYGLPVTDFGAPQQLYSLDPTTGQVTAGPLLSPQGLVHDGAHLFFDGSTLDVVNAVGLYTINTTTGAVTQDFAFSSNIGGVYAAAAMSTAVPEPASLVLLGTGLVVGGLGYLRRRRRGVTMVDPDPELRGKGDQAVGL